MHEYDVETILQYSCERTDNAEADYFLEAAIAVY